MAFEHKPNRGSLFRNDKKEKDTHPDSKGSALIDGKEYWIAAWRNAEPGKKVYWSLAFELKEEQKQAASSGDSRHPESHEDPGADLDDEIPF